MGHKGPNGEEERKEMKGNKIKDKNTMKKVPKNKKKREES